MYSFAQRPDTTVVDEPLYAYYLKNSNAKSFHPGAEEILKSLENKGEKVVQMMLSEESADVLFYKNMTHHLLKLDRSFLSKMINVFLTRHPKEMIASFAKVIPNPTIDDIGYARHTELLGYFETLNIKPIVIDSKRILLNPEKVLSQLCDMIKIPFDRIERIKLYGCSIIHAKKRVKSLNVKKPKSTNTVVTNFNKRSVLIPFFSNEFICAQ